MNKRWLIFGGSATIVIVALLIVFMVISKQHQPEKTVDTFTEAIEDKDVKALKELIEPDEKEAKLNKESLSALIDYLHANNESYQVIKDGLQSQVDNEDFTTSNEQISLIKDGKTMGIFSNYKLKVKTVNLKVKGLEEEEELNLTLADSDEELTNTEDEEDIYGPLLPGEYDVEANIMNNLGTFNDEETVDAWGSSDVSFLIDSESLARENDDVQKDIINAANEFNVDMSAYVASGFEVDKFMNATEDFKDVFSQLDNGFDAIKEYVEKMESQFLEATVDMDELDLSQFDGEWQAEVTMFVSYDEKIKIEDEKMEDLSYDELRTFSLIYDEDEEKWMIDDFMGEPYDESEVEDWENKEEIKIDDSKKYEWSDEDSFI